MKQFTLIAQDGDLKDEFETDSLMKGLEYSKFRGYEGVEVIDNHNDRVNHYINTMLCPWLMEESNNHMAWAQVDEDTFNKEMVVG